MTTKPDDNNNNNEYEYSQETLKYGIGSAMRKARNFLVVADQASPYTQEEWDHAQGVLCRLHNETRLAINAVGSGFPHGPVRDAFVIEFATHLENKTWG